MNEDLHHILLGCGYKYTPARHLPENTSLYTRDHRKGYYVKDYVTKTGVFTIALILRDDPYIKLPTAYILQLPDSCRGRLIPHITHGYSLCYVTEMEADWNPNDLGNTYRDVDTQIQLTLNNAVVSAERGARNDTELEGEFFAYWKPEERLFLLTKPEKLANLSTLLAESTLSDGTRHREYVTVTAFPNEGYNESAKWLALRKFKPDSLKAGPITTHYILIKPIRLSGMMWPPTSFSDVLTWLAEVDHTARDRLIDSLQHETKKRHIILLDIEHQDTLAIYVEIDQNAAGLKRHRKARKASTRHLVSVFSSKLVSSKFKRLYVCKADRDTLLSRNLPRPGVGNLSNKRIALIGCGTIGSYLAGLLLRSGAGCGSCYLHLYDDDILSAHNFGRHALTGHEFGLNKAIALASNLMDSVHIAKSIKGFESQFPITPTALSNYDIVIDATGRPPVSKRLAAIARTMSNEKRPTLIHAFNDGNGRASKILIDDGSCCYGCMLTESATHRNGIDLRFENIDQERERHISCGSTYTPYDAAVSHITAALAQEAVLNTLEPMIPWTYSEHMLVGSRSKKPRLLKRQPDCPICNARH